MFTSRRTELSEIRSYEGDESHQIVDFSEFETDFTSPFHRADTHKSQWLMTTGVAGLVGAMVVGGTLLGTFGLGGVERTVETAQVIQTAEILQENTDDETIERPVLGVLGIARIVGRRELTGGIDEGTAATLTAALAPDQQSNDLVGSLAPEYARSNAGTRRKPAVDKPRVLAAPPATSNDPLRTAALTPAAIGDSTSLTSSRSQIREEVITVAKGQTLVGILTRKGVPRYEARRLIAALEPVFPTRLLQDGQKLKFSFATERDSLGQAITRPLSLSLDAGETRQVLVELDTGGRFVGSYTSKGTAVASARDGQGQIRSTGKIGKSFFVSAKAQGIPKSVIAEMTRVHSFDVDFQREVRSGDSYEVFYGQPLTGKKRGRKVVLYTALTLKGKTKGYFRYTTPEDGITGYFDKTGRSVTSVLMRTPISGARVSSRFGMRKHPILGYSRMHSGIDFAAPRGTPIKAAGNGVIERAGRAGAYGKYIRIRHVNGYKTAYAHMHRFAKGMKPGKRVRQGQVIGYVGSTGRSTGPHLHYEVLRNKKKLNPMKVRVGKGRRLRGKGLARFVKHRDRILAMMQEAPTSTQVAEAKQAAR